MIGTGNSGHDIAQDLHSSGAEVTLVQRSPTLITNIEPSAQLAYAAYNEGTLEDNDLIATSMPLTLAKRSHVLLTEQSQRTRPAAARRARRASASSSISATTAPAGSSNTSPAAAAIISTSAAPIWSPSGAIGLIQFADIESFVADGVRMKSGERLAADLIVLATGYKAQEVLVRKLFGDEIAARVGPIWGFGEGQELRNMYTPHAAARPLVHRRQPRAVPHLLEVSGAADQGDRGRVVAAERMRSPLRASDDPGSRGR